MVDLASQSTVFNIVLESDIYVDFLSSGVRSSFGVGWWVDVNWLGTNTTKNRFGLPLTVSAGNGTTTDVLNPGSPTQTSLFWVIWKFTVQSLSPVW